MKTVNNIIAISKLSISAVFAVMFISFISIITSNTYAIALALILFTILGWVLYELWNRTNAIITLTDDNKVTKRNIWYLEEDITKLETKIQILRDKVDQQKRRES